MSIISQSVYKGKIVEYADRLSLLNTPKHLLHQGAVVRRTISRSETKSRAVVDPRERPDPLELRQRLPLCLALSVCGGCLP
jgi:hypothetical protein